MGYGGGWGSRYGPAFPYAPPMMPFQVMGADYYYSPQNPDMRGYSRMWSWRPADGNAVPPTQYEAPFSAEYPPQGVQYHSLRPAVPATEGPNYSKPAAHIRKRRQIMGYPFGMGYGGMGGYGSNYANTASYAGSSAGQYNGYGNMGMGMMPFMG